MLESEHFCRFLYFSTAQIMRLDLHIFVWNDVELQLVTAF